MVYLLAHEGKLEQAEPGQGYDAKAAFERLTARRAALWTTTFVLLEIASAAARRPY